MTKLKETESNLQIRISIGGDLTGSGTLRLCVRGKIGQLAHALLKNRNYNFSATLFISQDCMFYILLDAERIISSLGIYNCLIRSVHVEISFFMNRRFDPFTGE